VRRESRFRVCSCSRARIGVLARKRGSMSSRDHEERKKRRQVWMEETRLSWTNPLVSRTGGANCEIIRGSRRDIDQARSLSTLGSSAIDIRGCEIRPQPRARQKVSPRRPIESRRRVPFSLPLLRGILQLANVARFIVDTRRDIALYIVHGYCISTKHLFMILSRFAVLSVRER